MKSSKRREIELRFAGYVVADMLERSGTQFQFSPNESHVEAVDFTVLNGSNQPRKLKVKYRDNPSQARTLWKHWTHSRTQDADYLVVVTGDGDEVFADPSIEPMLGADRRTRLSVFN
jgi:hypothetical protein